MVSGRIVLFLVSLLALSIPNARSQTIEPGGTPHDVNLAINNPFEYAWKLFLFLNQQAKLGSAGIPDPEKGHVVDYDPDKPVVWETWAVATGGLFLRPGELNTSEVFKEGGVDPGPWESLPRDIAVPKRLDPDLTALLSDPQKRATVVQQFEQSTNGQMITIAPGVTVEGEVETRMNKSTFDTIRAKKLYNVEGLIAAFERAEKENDPMSIQFDLDSKEVKGKWIKLKTEVDKQRYHWRTIEYIDGTGKAVREAWGLSGFHIITKDLPLWFWCDFEHVDQEPQAIKEGRPSVDPTTRGPNASKGKDGVRDETKGSKWQYYRLRGIQIFFTDQFGKNTELANTLIEPIDSGASSCITCHAKATISGAINHTIKDRPFMINTLSSDFVAGLPDPNAFEKDGILLFLQTDFLWSMSVRARSEKQ